LGLGYTEPIFAIFSAHEIALGADDRSVPYFPIIKGRCHGNPCCEKGENNEGGLIPVAFFAVAFKNELEYHYLYVRINSKDDQATCDINLVGF